MGRFLNSSILMLLNASENYNSIKYSSFLSGLTPLGTQFYNSFMSNLFVTGSKNIYYYCYIIFYYVACGYDWFNISGVC